MRVEGYDGLYMVSELEARSLSSRNTLGDTTHNTNKIGLSWGWRKCIDVGWNPRWPIFHEKSGSREEHEEHEGNHEGKHERITQTNKNNHTYARSKYT